MNWSKGRWALWSLYKISLKNWTCCINAPSDSYSSGVNGENQTKLNEKSRVRHVEDVVLHDEDVCHNEGYYSP